MELKNFAVDYILAWFQSNRPEMDVRKDCAYKSSQIFWLV